LGQQFFEFVLCKLHWITFHIAKASGEFELGLIIVPR
jgi:hypothetical protein